MPRLPGPNLIGALLWIGECRVRSLDAVSDKGRLYNSWRLDRQCNLTFGFCKTFRGSRHERRIKHDPGFELNGQ